MIAETGNFPRDNVRRLRNRPYESYLELGSGSEGSADNCTVINDAVDGTTGRAVFIRAYNTSVFRGRLACLK